MLKPKKYSPAILALTVWMAVNAVFMALEVTVFNDSADLNNTILLVLMVASVVGLFVVKKYGLALTTFTIIYAFSFNAFNLIYFGFSVLNGTSALINAVATVFLLTTMLRSNQQ